MLKVVTGLARYECKDGRLFVQDHEVTGKDYGSRLAEVQAKLSSANKSNEELSTELCSLKDEVEALTHGLEEANSAEEYFEQELIDMATLKVSLKTDS